MNLKAYLFTLAGVLSTECLLKKFVFVTRFLPIWHPRELIQGRFHTLADNLIKLYPVAQLFLFKLPSHLSKKMLDLNPCPSIHNLG
jgi:hypothetical protein